MSRASFDLGLAKNWTNSYRVIRLSKPTEERRAKLELEGGFGITATWCSLNPIAAYMAEHIQVWAMSGDQGMSADGPRLKKNLKNLQKGKSLLVQFLPALYTNSERATVAGCKLSKSTQDMSPHVWSCSITSVGFEDCRFAAHLLNYDNEYLVWIIGQASGRNSSTCLFRSAECSYCHTGMPRADSSNSKLVCSITE